jgi:hypothetical protein
MRAKSKRYWTIKYSILTLVVFLPLLWSFRYVRNLYPATVWNMMMAGGDLETTRTYCILRGETLSGQTIDIRPVELTNAMYGRTWSMVNATVYNQSFKLTSLHPDNASLLQENGGVEKLPAGARIPELLSTWGNLYNNKLPASSPDRLRAIRIDMYRWASGDYSNYQTFIQTWREEL